MNIGIGTFLKNGLTKESIESALRKFAAAVVGGFQVQHKEDGTHTNVTLTTLEIAAVEDDGNVTGSLVPTTATQDLGAEIELSNGASHWRPWRSILVSDSINWHPFADAATNGMPTMTRSTRDLAISCGATGASGSPSLTGWSGATSSTLTVLGGGTTSSGNLIATAAVSAGTNVQTPELRLTDGITAPGATVGFAKIYVDTADGDLKVVFGDGTVKTLATDT